MELKRGFEFELQTTDRTGPDKDVFFYIDGERCTCADASRKLGKQYLNAHPELGNHNDYEFSLFLPGTPRTPLEQDRNFLTYKLRNRVHKPFNC